MYFRGKYYLALILSIILCSDTFGQQLPPENYSLRQLDSMHFKHRNNLKSFLNAKGLGGVHNNFKSVISSARANILPGNLNTSVSPTCYDTSARFFLYND